MSKRTNRGERRAVNATLLRKERAKTRQRTPSRSEQSRIAVRAQKKWGVFGTYYGLKRKRGRWTRSVALVCLAAEKSPIRAIAKSRRVPKSLFWKEGSRKFRIDTDVVQASSDLVLQAGAIIGPGDAIDFDGGTATIGSAIDHPDFGRSFTTAGHLFNGPTDEGTIALATSRGVTVRARLKRCVNARSTDYSILHPIDSAACDNLFLDLIRIGPLFIATPSDIGTTVFVLDNRTDSIETICRGVNARLRLPSGVYDNVILCDAVTRGGQSGAALVDGENRLWGFLIGVFDRFSVFMPAARMLRLERSQLA